MTEIKQKLVEDRLVDDIDRRFRDRLETLIKDIGSLYDVAEISAQRGLGKIVHTLIEEAAAMTHGVNPQVPAKEFGEVCVLIFEKLVDDKRIESCQS